MSNYADRIVTESSDVVSVNDVETVVISAGEQGTIGLQGIQDITGATGAASGGGTNGASGVGGAAGDGIIFVNCW